MPPKPKQSQSSITSSSSSSSSTGAVPSLSKVHSKLSRSLALAIAPKTGIASLSILQWCPEDILCNIFTYCNGKELANNSIVCREFYFATYLIGRRRFEAHFGGTPDPSLPRIKLFSLLNRCRMVNHEANMRDLFMWSCIRGYTKMLNTILSQTSTFAWHIVETRIPSTGVTPLILASEYNRSSVMKLLLQHQADPTKISNNGLQPIHICARTGKLNLVHILLKHNKDLCNSVTNNNYTPLMFASMGGHLSIVSMLLDYGALPDTTTQIHDDQGNETAMHIAAYHGFTEVIAKLLSAGGNPNIQMRNGRTPLLIACELGWVDIVKLLLTRSFIIPVDLLLTTDSGKTALYVACEHGYEELVPILLEAGSNVTAATRRNKIPLYVAAEKGFITIARLLLQHADATGADVFAQTKYGTTPMYIASRTSNKAMKDLLLNHVHNSKKKNSSSSSSSFTAVPAPVHVSTDLPQANTLFAEELSNHTRKSLGLTTPYNGENPAVPFSSVPLISDSSTKKVPKSQSINRNNSSSQYTTISNHHDTGNGLLTISSGISRTPSNSSATALSTVSSAATNLPTGNTASEMKIRERARQAQEDAEEAIRQAEMQDKHRRQAVELAERAKRRLEEKATMEAAQKAQLEAESIAKKEKEELRRKEKEKQIALDFQARRGNKITSNVNSTNLPLGNNASTNVKTNTHSNTSTKTNDKRMNSVAKTIDPRPDGEGRIMNDIIHSEESIQEGSSVNISHNTSIVSQNDDYSKEAVISSGSVTFPLRPTSVRNLLQRSTVLENEGTVVVNNVSSSLPYVKDPNSTSPNTSFNFGE